MKKLLKSALSFVLCASMLLGFFALSAPEAQAQTNSIESYISQSSLSPAPAATDNATLAKLINRISNFLLNDVLLNVISMFILRGNHIGSYSDFDFDNAGVFFKGCESFIDAPAADACWNVGYSQRSIVPADFGTPFKYARGSYVPWWYSTEIYTDDDGNTEDLKVRTVILDDGRGKVVFSVIDCIGLSNTDVRKIRAAAAEVSAMQNIIALNVSATHTHSGIDSQGVWNAPLTTMAHNMLSVSTLGALPIKNGVNETYLNTIIEQTVASIESACADMTSGELNYCSTDISDYVYDRTPPYSYDANLYRLMFEPFDESKKATVIATFGCHPESASYDFLTTDDGLKTDSKITADFIYYMEKLINKAGHNFIYIQGDVGTVTSSRGKSNDGIDGLNSHDTAMRYGYELGYITLGMTMTETERIALNSSLGDVLGISENASNENYSIWYEDRPVETAVDVEPVLNIRMEQFLVEVQNNMAKILLKTGLASNSLVYDWKTAKYYTLTEIGYMEIGDALKVFLCPGETFNEIVLGGDCLNDFQYDSLRSLYGDNLIVCDLMNDAAGYIEPDNYYVIAGYQYDAEKDSLESDTWCLLVSMGKNTASTIVGKFIELVDSVR